MERFIDRLGQAPLWVAAAAGALAGCLLIILPEPALVAGIAALCAGHMVCDILRLRRLDARWQAARRRTERRCEEFDALQTAAMRRRAAHGGI